MSIHDQGTLEIIKREYERDLAEMPLARTLDDVPAFYECITPEWLTAVVRTQHPEATVTLTPPPSMPQDMQTKETTLCFLRRIGQAIDDLNSLDAFTGPR